MLPGRTLLSFRPPFHTSFLEDKDILKRGGIVRSLKIAGSEVQRNSREDKHGGKDGDQCAGSSTSLKWK